MSRNQHIPQLLARAQSGNSWLSKCVDPDRLEANLRVVLANIDKPIRNGKVDEASLDAAKSLLNAGTEQIDQELAATRAWLDSLVISARSSMSSMRTTSTGFSIGSSQLSTTDSLVSAYTQHSRDMAMSGNSPSDQASHSRSMQLCLDETTGVCGTTSTNENKNDHCEVDTRSSRKSKPSEKTWYCPICRELKVAKKADMRRHLERSCHELQRMSFGNWIGCPYCPNAPSVNKDQHVAHLFDCHMYQHEPPTPNETTRLRSLILQPQLASALHKELTMRGLRADCWSELTWPSIDLTSPIKDAEAGYRPDDPSAGYQDPSSFITKLLDLANYGGFPLGSESQAPLPHFTPHTTTQTFVRDGQHYLNDTHMESSTDMTTVAPFSDMPNSAFRRPQSPAAYVDNTVLPSRLSFSSISSPTSWRSNPFRRSINSVRELDHNNRS